MNPGRIRTQGTERRSQASAHRRDHAVGAWSVAHGLCFVLCALYFAVPAHADPHLDYMLNCQGCHGPDGSGAAGAAPSFRGQVGKFLKIPGGREYLIAVPGTSRSELDDASTAALLNWIVYEFSRDQVPSDFVPFTPAEVTRHRRPALSDPAAVRKRLIESMP